MGGFGKTSLGRKMYSNNEVNGLFSSGAWGYVSNDYGPRELLLYYTILSLIYKFINIDIISRL